jgi:hypothetical protein
MGSRAISAEILLDLARHQAWADTAHWKALHENGALLEDAEIRKRLNHIVMATRMLYRHGDPHAYRPGAGRNTGPIGDEGR